MGTEIDGFESSERPACVGCSERAPKTDTNHTLISAAFGWRVTRAVKPDGTRSMEWRCAKCWRQYKASQAVR